MAKISRFEDLNAWIEARKLSQMVFDLCKKLIASKEYDLSNQIKRSSVSIMANIAEGFGRFGFKDSKQFFTTAKGSLLETQSHLYALKDFGLLDEKEFCIYYDQTIVASKLLNGLISNTIRQMSKIQDSK
jgi:four helix bundle protein